MALLITPYAGGVTNNPVFFAVGSSGTATGRLTATVSGQYAHAETQFLTLSSVTVQGSGRYLLSTGTEGVNSSSSSGYGYALASFAKPTGSSWMYISGIHTADYNYDHGSDISFLNLT